MKKFLLLLAFVSSISIAQPIEFIVSASPGGPNDTVTRKIAEKIEKSTNLQIIVMNKPGAAQTIGYTHVLNSNKPTLIMSTPEIVNHEVYSHIDELYNAGYFSNIVFVSEKSEIRNLKQLVELSKTREINFGHGGVGTYSHMSMELICKTTLKCLGVPYKSGAEGMLGVMTGQIDAYALASYGSYQFLDNNRVTAIHSIKASKDKSWFKLFAKNISAKDKETIVNVLKSQDAKFYSDMGFEK
jgi:tripartite-type tricarboxylate transporter receptor subunit TctC